MSTPNISEYRERFNLVGGEREAKRILLEHECRALPAVDRFKIAVLADNPGMLRSAILETDGEVICKYGMLLETNYTYMLGDAIGIFWGSVETVSELLTHIDASTLDTAEFYPIHNAVSRMGRYGAKDDADALKILRLVLDHVKKIGRADAIDKTNNLGETALMFAASSGSVEAVKVLVEAGADPDIVSSKGWTALGYAHNEDNKAVIEVLGSAQRR